MPWSRVSWLRAAGSAAVILVAGWGAFVAGQTPPTAETPAVPAPVSASAQRIYGEARQQLLQVRTLLKGQDSQASVGSGFLVSAEGHILTNYHVVSEAALQPERYRLVYSTAERREGPLQLLAFDAIHDLAVVKPVDPAPLAGHGALHFRPRDQALAQGERIYSLGNPLDVGFAVIEGTYNGLVERSFYPTIFFSGSLNPGVSGGPTLDGQGAVIGINVAARRDGEQVSFLVPAAFAEDLLQQARTAAPITGPAYPALVKQLWAHQAALTSRFLEQPWRNAGHPRYVIPLPQDAFMRCWGRSTPAEAKGLEYEHAECEMDTRIFVSGWLTTGSLNVRHEAYDGARLGTLRFAQRYSASFANEAFGRVGDAARTAPQCHERYVDRDGLPLRAVLCLSAYKKLTGLFDASLLVATVDAPQQGVQGRFDAQGVSYDNALALAAHYLEGFPVDQTPDGALIAAAPPPAEPPLLVDALVAVVDVLDRDGRARVTVPVRRWPLTIGRAVSCDIVLDDPYVAPRHATLGEHDGGLQLVVGETVNGAWLGKRRVAAGERIALAGGDVVQIGGTRLRIRGAADALAPERRWVPEASGSVRTVLLLVLLFTAWNAGELWLRDDPGGRATDYLPVLIGGPIAVAIWAAFWAVGSKLIRHRFDFWSHSRIALLAMLAMGVATLVLPVFAFTSGWAWPSRIGPIVVSAIAWAAVGAHIHRLLPGRPRVLAAVMASLFVVGFGLFGIHQYETQDRVFPELYVATLAPPSLRLAPAVSTATFIDEAKSLKAILESHVADDDRPGD